MDLRIVHVQSPDVLETLLRGSIGVDPAYVQHLSRKFQFKTYVVTGVDNRAANLLKQEMLAIGAEAAVSRGIAGFKKGCSAVLLGGTEQQYARLIDKLDKQPFGLRALGKKLAALTAQTASPGYLDCAGRRIDYRAQPIIIGIVNVTPDSFYDGGRYSEPASGKKHVDRLIDEGADIIDIGGESSRPGSDTLNAREELARIAPVVKHAVKQGACVSVDTRSSAVARAVLNEGAHIINDISALRDSVDMGAVIAKFKAAVVLMHMRGRPKTMQIMPRYRDVIMEISAFLNGQAAYARSRGIEPERIVIDPGIGFGKTLDHNMTILRHTGSFAGLGYPVMIGVSRKSMIDHYMKQHQCAALAPADRLPGSLAIVLDGWRRGARFFRVHDVAATRQAFMIAQGLEQ
jgi:dihydropteroate synthase